jgi:hypothetical protein
LDEGNPPREERDLGLQFSEGRSPTSTSPDEPGVMQLASLWSIDPTSLDEAFKEPATGLWGSVARAQEFV